jgi:predicted  nucleic acid-binding Zn-ribbon protein
VTQLIQRRTQNIQNARMRISDLLNSKEASEKEIFLLRGRLEETSNDLKAEIKRIS